MPSSTTTTNTTTTSPTRVRLNAPAKLNLGLRVVGRRPDGYHLLESLFVPVDLADDIELELSPGAGAGTRVDLVLRDGRDGEGQDREGHEGQALDGDARRPGQEGAPAAVPTDDRNLAVRAAYAFLERAGVEAAVRITLSKRIPAAAGMGGGSSDAGAVLRGLQEALPGRLSPEALGEAALGLGADVPFFLDPTPVLVSGIGEARRAAGPLPSLVFVLANPRVEVSTAEVFAGRAASGAPYSPEGGLALDLEALRRAGFGDPAAWSALLRNDLETAAAALCPAMSALKVELVSTGAVATGQSGSGATVFGLFADEAAATRACTSLSANDSAWFRVAISPAAR